MSPKTYPGNDTLLERIHRNFTAYAFDAEQCERVDGMMRAARDLARIIVHLTPESREQSLSLTHLEEALMWAQEAVIRNEGKTVIHPEGKGEEADHGQP